VKSSQVFKFRFDLFNALKSEHILCNKSTLNTQSVDLLLQVQRPVCKMTLPCIKAVMELKNIISYQLLYTCSHSTWSRSKTLQRFEISPFLHVLYITVVCISKFLKGCFHCNQSLHVILTMKTSKCNFLSDSQPINRICSLLLLSNPSLHLPLILQMWVYELSLDVRITVQILTMLTATL